MERFTATILMKLFLNISMKGVEAIMPKDYTAPWPSGNDVETGLSLTPVRDRKEEEKFEVSH